MILMILNIQSVFLTIFGLLGVLLAFIATFFFHYIVMGYTALTILDFLSLFLIVGIAADDMLLGIHSDDVGICWTWFVQRFKLGILV